MILKDNNATSSNLIRNVILLLGAIGLSYATWFYYPSLTTKKINDVWLCDAETRRGFYFISNGDKYGNAFTQSNKTAFEGKYSCRVGSGEGYQYGFGSEISDLKKGETYIVSVWTKKETANGIAYLVIQDENKNFDFNIEKSSDEKGSWKLLQQEIKIPFDKEINLVNIYVMTNGQGEIFFDNLKIEKKNNSVIKNTSSFQAEVINLIIKEKSFSKLKKKREKALNDGVLQQGDDDWVSAKMISSIDNENLSVKLRLKGDWLDHLKGKKWSFRVKVKDPFAFKGMKTFSFQTPEARGHLDEWVLHQWWKKEDILTPRFDFVELRINGEAIGIYAWEEHFDKQLVESQNRREGPIVRFSEDGFWENNKQMVGEYSDNPFRRPNNISSSQNAPIKPFKESKLKASPQLEKQFEIAQNLLHQYQFQLQNPEQIFDLKKMAKYYAICDAMQAYHGTAWHNERFYYNPVISKLEPIGYDGFPTYNKPRAFLGEGGMNKNKFSKEDSKSQLFLNQAFLKEYNYHLFLFSKNEYLNQLVAELQNEIKAREAFLQKEYPFYRFSFDEFRKKAIGLNTAILPINDISVAAYKESSSELSVWNIHGMPIEIIGFGNTNKTQSFTLENPELIKGSMNKRKDKPFSLKISGKYNYLFYRVFGDNEIYFSKINPWKQPKDFVPAQSLFSNNKLTEGDFFSIKNKNEVRFKFGEHIVSKDIIIPKGYNVFFEAGTSLDLIKNAKFISYSPIFMMGNNTQPIKIFSSDKTANGFTVLQSDKKSTLNYVTFENMNTLNYQGWTLTGAVTFYESDVDISNCIFTKNHCEDGLNIIRSTFELKDSEVSYTASDGFDADFCKGFVENSKFLNTTNDGIDFSGSVITISNCEMDECGDKGISVGEASNVTVINSSVKNAIIGVASKDLSKLTIENISLEKCVQGFTAYQKKPEFGGSDIVVKNYEAIDVDKLYNIRVGCTLDLKGRMIKGE